jgi:hypothetical protein
MQSGARVKVLKTLERMKGVAPSYSAWKSPNFRNVFKNRSDILQLFGRLRSLRNFSLSEWRLPPARSFFAAQLLWCTKIPLDAPLSFGHRRSRNWVIEHDILPPAIECPRRRQERPVTAEISRTAHPLAWGVIRGHIHIRPHEGPVPAPLRTALMISWRLRSA